MRTIGTFVATVMLTATVMMAHPGTGGAAIVPGVDALWDTSVVPSVPNWPDDNSVEVGVGFVTSEDISVVGVRFYKGDQNIGTHLGSLWHSDGTLLATATFTDETTDGWQDVIFDTPVPMSPGDLYIASYFVPIGFYAAENDFFWTSLTNGPVTAVTGLDALGNGVYSYSQTSTFPEFSYRQSNYWVTPLWTTNGPPVVDAGPDTSGDEGAAIALAGAASDPDGDGLTVTWSVSSGPDDGGSCTFANDTSPSTSITCDDDGVVVATLTADDGISPPVSDSVTVTVGNLAPTLSLDFGDGAPIPIGQAFSLTGTIADPGANDTHTCTVDWGDGASDTGADCNVVHTYGTAGVYTISATALDDDGASATADGLVVVYDAQAGFVTGGGWIQSPAGAYAAEPAVTGKANFGFVSKYKKGATVPTGSTTFQFNTGDLSFHSSNYDWLVVTGSDYARFKGTGSLNGVDGYKFMIWAGDGSPDTFRIKISTESAAGDETVVYDNGTNQAIGGGQVVVHSNSK